MVGVTLILVALLLLYLLYYWFVVCQPVNLHFAETTNNKSIIDSIANFKQSFRPTIWCFNTHLQTIYNVLLRPNIIVDYFSELFVFNCGGEILLDWVEDPALMAQKNKDVEEQDKSTVVVLSGVCGGSQEIEIKHFVAVCKKAGHRVVVVNYRGAQTRLKTERFGLDENDLEVVINHIRKSVGQRSHMIGVGFSLGSNILVRYLGKAGKNTPLSCCMSISNPYNLNTATKMLRNPVASKVYDKVFTTKRKDMVMRHLDIYSKSPDFDIKKFESISSTREFDDVISRFIVKYDNVDDFYNFSSCESYIPKIQVPTLFLNSLDDPISSQESIPTQLIKNNTHCILATTARGGHVAWIEGMVPTGPSWMEHTCMQYIQAVINTTN
ncbi:ABHD1 [Acrasis kona]|uniref:ABHD1 n=1 Tax=Acrasis kona TaxID=1008807 RepID=A0AAW2YWA6_9EUKA